MDRVVCTHEGCFSRLETHRNARETNEAAATARRSVVEGYCPPIVSLVAKDIMYPVHANRGHELLYVMRGMGVVYANTFATRVRAGDLLYVSPYVSHGFALDKGSSALLTGADVDNTLEFSEYAEGVGLRHLVVHGVRRNRRLHQALTYMAEHPQHMREGIHIADQLSTVFDCLVDIVETWGYACPHPEPTRMDKIGRVAYTSSIVGNPTVAQVAREVGMSPTHLSRTFRRLFGVTFPQYTAIAQVNGARRLLTQTDLPVAEISSTCGFQTIRSFNRQFREIAGMTPTEYREREAPSQVTDYGIGPLAGPVRTVFEELAARCPKGPSVTLASTAAERRLKA